ncbi:MULTISPECIES: arsenic transporter [Rhizobium]|uniref:Arsenical pump membrane protein n=1 Tax=Rhizobium wenxiniae TaxID=1737357 RepID=A0A7W9YAU7_9HYPH|nr:arsenic transporter [Rhizobium wenxiniae]MBB6164543.1 arsenical pump membrane protein [Rhizobium wenxiniae]GGG07589.1 arsenic transporter [Rhizobium wenxiniae]
MILTWGISALTVLGVVTRPFRWPEAIWAVGGALLLLAVGSIGYADVWSGLARGFDVYLFLIGMMMLSELARQQGLFDWLASVATSHARGSPRRLFVLIYAVGIVTTVFLSNDATAVVLTPAVHAACRAAKVKDPLPYLLICAFIANAASFVLPISNPANLVIFSNGTMPSLTHWLSMFALPSAAAIIVTFIALYWTQRSALAADTLSVAQPIALSSRARLTGIALVATAIVMVGSSVLGWDLGLPTFASGLLSTTLVLLLERKGPKMLLRHISWSVLPLVAGLFVVVGALEKSGLVDRLSSLLVNVASAYPASGALGVGAMVALVSNLVNNLPAGLVAGGVVQAAQATDKMAGAVLIGIDLGPNLSITGSLATILWLNALRRDGIDITAWAFMKLGAIVMMPALIVSLFML